MSMNLTNAVEVMTLMGGGYAVLLGGWKISRNIYQKFDRVFTDTSEIKAQLLPNSGSSLCDRVEAGAKNIAACADAIERMQGRQRMIMDALDFGTLEFDAEGNCIDVNEILLRLFDLEETDFFGIGWLNLVIDPEFEQQWGRVIKSRGTISRPLTFAGGGKVVACTFSSAPSGNYHFARLMFHGNPISSVS